MRLRSGLVACSPREDDLTEARRHLEACDVCRSMVEMRVGRPVARASECPRESEWPLVAAGLKEKEQAGALLRHAALCDHCGPLLRQSVEDFSEDLTAEEETMLAGLETSQARWQRGMAAKLSSPRRSWSIGAWLGEHLPPVPAIPRWAFAGGLSL